MSNEHEGIDRSFQYFEKLMKDVAEFGDTLFTESDARIKIIDTMLIDVLGWNKSQILTSEHAGPGFLDYKLSVDELGKVIVEAKREQRSFDLTTRECGGAFKLSGPVFKNSDVQEGIKQAIEYSAYKGVELACVTKLTARFVRYILKEDHLFCQVPDLTRVLRLTELPVTVSKAYHIPQARLNLR